MPGDNRFNSSETSTTNEIPIRIVADGRSGLDEAKRSHPVSNQVDRFTDKLNDMQASQQSMVDLERLSRLSSGRLNCDRVERRPGKKSELAAHLEDVEIRSEA